MRKQFEKALPGVRVVDGERTLASGPIFWPVILLFGQLSSLAGGLILWPVVLFSGQWSYSLVITVVRLGGADERAA